MADRCEKTELPTDMCAHCLGHTDPDAPDRTAHPLVPARAFWIVAQYPGRCSGCSEWYRAGVQIIRDGDGWLSECCVDPG